MDDAEKRRLEDLPWKHAGYRVFSRWMASDPAFFIVRRFGALNARVILCLQDEIAKHEEELDALDRHFRADALPDDTNNGSFRNDPCMERKKLIEETLRGKLAKYNKFINGYAQLVSRPPLNPIDVGLVRQWFNESRPAAIDDVEANYIRYDDDLVPVQPKTRSWFRKRLESTYLLNTPMMRPIFGREPPDYRIISDDRTVWQDDKRIEMFSSLMTGFVGLSMLIGPLWVLAYVTKPHTRLGIITGFIVLFYAAVAVATTARPWESLAATAAYSAVLMVFFSR
ncbi:MAG: hypothetical protein M1839_003301 [Geoglossum umbratile]|nr:MAG: hypothetical protein M1839_003301 [Geoglossum umbratile]